MIAIVGATASRNSWVAEFLLPWWLTFSTSAARGILLQHGMLRLSLRVTWEQQRSVSVFQFQYQRIVVLRRCCSIGRRYFWPQKLTLHVIKRKVFSSHSVVNRYILVSRQCFEFCQRRIINFASNPQSPNTEILQNRTQASHMILMRGCHSHYIDFLEPSRPQIRRLGLLAKIASSSLLLAGESTERAAPSINKVLPAGETTNKESPCPTSSTVTSSLPPGTRGENG
jgi:hypothetical protein